MGTNKALLPFKDQTNIERIKDELSGRFDEMILVTNEPEAYTFLNMKTVSDEFPGKGPLAGLHAGLNASFYEYNIVVACDMPFASAEVASKLVPFLQDYDAVIPVINGKRHPLFAAYRKRIAQEIGACLQQDRLRMIHLLEKLTVCYLKEEDLQLPDSHLERVFFNMNHPNEYENAKAWVEKENSLL